MAPELGFVWHVQEAACGMKKQMCHDCKKRIVSREANGTLCEPCADWAGWENQHSDDAHQEILDGEEMVIAAELLESIRGEMENCPICQNYPHPRDTFKAGHKNTAPKSYTSHAECGHPRTPKARELCRRARRKEASK